MGKHLNLALVLLIAVLLPSKVPAQVLTQQVNSLLSNKCSGLGISEPQNFEPETVAGLDTNLADICLKQGDDGPGAGFGGSTGGGAAAFQELY
jgi:hypothetical protein